MGKIEKYDVFRQYCGDTKLGQLCRMKVEKGEKGWKTIKIFIKISLAISIPLYSYLKSPPTWDRNSNIKMTSPKISPFFILFNYN
jgi:hypothetical protein